MGRGTGSFMLGLFTGLALGLLFAPRPGEASRALLLEKAEGYATFWLDRLRALRENMARKTGLEFAEPHRPREETPQEGPESY